MRQRLRSLTLTNFRCFSQIQIDLSPETGWTCLAGINGAGKSSILQAIALLLLGPDLGADVGGQLLADLRRRGAETATIAGTFVDDQGVETRVALTLTGGSKALVLSEGEPWLWNHLHSSVFLSYGASRNLSRHTESRYDNMNVAARRQMTLFEPLTQLTSAEVLLKQTADANRVGKLFAASIDLIFGSVLRVHSVSSFLMEGDSENLSALDLPDGFRSSAAWIVDLCAVWCRDNPEIEDLKPSDVEAIVLIDEIDLHLHPSLQRQLVPNLRKTFPKVQWVVTTHSPLVLANFSREELIALDRTAPGGVRTLDREIKGFTADEIYAWLMDTPPSGVAIQNELEQAQVGEASPELAAILRTSLQVNEAQARELVARSRALLEDLRPE